MAGKENPEGNGHNDYSMLGEKFFIMPGIPLQLQIEGIFGSLKGVLAGMVPDEYLIIQGQFSGIADKLFKGNRATVRYVQKGVVYGFSSEFIGVILTPVELAFIKYPEKVETIELRSHKRIECFLPAELIFGKERHQGTILDISEGGCRCLIKASNEKELPALKINEQLTLMFQVPGIEGNQTISGEIRDTHYNLQFDTEEMRLGVKFHEDTSEVLKKIAEYIFSIDLF